METETAIELAILNWLNARSDCLAFKVGNKSKQGRGVRNHSANGVADIVANISYAEMCFTLYLEVKTKIGKQRPSQFEFEKKIKSLNGFYYIVRSIEDAEKALKDARHIIMNSIQIAQIPW